MTGTAALASPTPTHGSCLRQTGRAYLVYTICVLIYISTLFSDGFHGFKLPAKNIKRVGEHIFVGFMRMAKYISRKKND